MTTAHDNQHAASRRLPRARLAPVGGRGGAGVAAWIAGVGLALGAGWLAFSALRPLTTGAPASVETLDAPDGPSLATRPIDARQRDLDALADGANLFAPDRMAWPVVAAAPAPEDSEPEIERTTAEQPRVVADADAGSETPSGFDAIDAIPISDDAPASIRQRLNALSLVGVYGVGDRFTATIRDSTLPKQEGQTRDYRPGDTVGTEQWELLAVDPRTDRVILHRAGHNLELRMYPEVVVAAAPEASSPAPADAASPDGVRRDLEAAGVASDDIEEFLRLAESDEALEGDAQASAEQPAEAAEPAQGAARPMPAELSALLRMMAQDTAKRRSDQRETPEREKPREPEGEPEGG